MTKNYKANKKGFILYIIIFFSIIPLLGCYLSEKDKIINFIILSIPACLFIWIYLDTGYKIENDKLFYRSAFLRGKIDISEIDSITIGKTMWSGVKPALTKNGLIIKYKYNEIYIAPESNSELVSDLLNINPQIKIYDNL